jgi:ABC-type sugar transport system substrate-binding protein
MGKSSRRLGGTRAGRTTALAAGLSALVLGVAACGSSGVDGGDSGGSGGGDDAAAESVVDLDTVSDEDAQKMADLAFGTTDISLDSLDPTVQEALKRAAIELTPEQKDKAFECWQATTCEIGDGKTTLGIAEGFGGNLWRKVAKMEIILQAMTYPDIGKIIFTDANADLPTFLANVRSLSSQGAKAIVSYNDFGTAALPAFKAAQAQGAKISTYVGPTPDAPADSLSNQITGDVCAMGEEMEKVAVDDLGLTGELAILNGTPGNPQGAAWNKCLEDSLPSGVEIGQKVDTDWTLAGAFDAGSALVSSGTDYGAIFYDYADPIPQVVEAYSKADKKIPAIITWTSNNGMARVWEDKLGTPDEFPLYHTSALTWESRASVTAVMKELAGEEVEPVVIVPRPFVKAEKGYYLSDRPDDYPGPSALVPDDVMTRMLSDG